MARQRISEYRAKTILFNELGLDYAGVSVDSTQDISPQLSELDQAKKYIVKVDQGVKKRMKRGLIALHKSVNEIPDAIAEIAKQSFTQFLIEPMAEYDNQNEKYFAIQRVREGFNVTFSPHGGVDIEEHEESVMSVLLPYSSSGARSLDENSSHSVRTITDAIGLPGETLEKILRAFDKYYFSFLEINPLVIHNSEFLILDLAVEVDSVADFFVDRRWTSADFTFGDKGQKTEEEKVVAELKEQSQAAFTLDVLNPDGSIFMLLSGGGASLVLADEVANMGLGEQLANYGEYSGNPNAEETYLYTTQVLKLLLRSEAAKKVLIIGGGVANFTDIKATFKGVIKALDEYKDALRDQHVRVYVRRGGPNQKEGLKQMQDFLEKEDLLGRVVGPEVVLTDIVKDAIEVLV
jgi:succinyl-CoA synthetase beta subunit